MAPNNGGVTLDQAGIVASFPMDGKVKNFNISFNYQRKINYKQAFYGEVATGASFADQLYDMATVVEQRGTFNPWDQHHKSADLLSQSDAGAGDQSQAVDDGQDH